MKSTNATTFITFRIPKRPSLPRSLFFFIFYINFRATNSNSNFRLISLRIVTFYRYQKHNFVTNKNPYFKNNFQQAATEPLQGVLHVLCLLKNIFYYYSFLFFQNY